MTSDRWTDRLSEYIDDELPTDERAQLEAHLAGCPACARTVDELLAVVRAAAALRDAPPPRELWTGIAARIAAPVIPIRPAPPPRRLSFTLPQLAAASVALVAASGALVWALLSRGPAAGGPVAAAPAAAPPAPAPAPPSAEAAAAPAPTRLAGPVEEGPAAERPAEGPAAAPTPDRRPASAGGAAGAAAGAGLVLASGADRRGYDRAVSDLEGVLRRGRGRLQPETVQALEQSLAAIDSAIAEARRALARDPGSPYLNAHLTDTLRRKVELLQQVGTLVGQT